MSISLNYTDKTTAMAQKAVHTLVPILRFHSRYQTKVPALLLHNSQPFRLVNGLAPPLYIHLYIQVGDVCFDRADGEK